MSRAVHGLESEDLFFNRGEEHVVLVVFPVTRRLPQVVENIWGDHLLKSTYPVLFLNKTINTLIKISNIKKLILYRQLSNPYKSFKLLVNELSFGKKETASGRQVVEKEKFLFFSDLPVVPLLGFLLELHPLLEVFLVGKADSVNSLQSFHVLVSFKIS